jgi:hypothetical protein
MKFRNPWIDPRVADLRPEAVRAYLTQHGWTEVGPAENPALVRFERADDPDAAPTLFLPLRSGDGASVQWMIELVGELATWQGRFAGDVLSDLLPSDERNGPNGAAPALPTAEKSQR